MNNKLKVGLASVFLCLSALVMPVALADLPNPTSVSITTVQQIYNILDNLIGWIFTFFFAVAVVFLLSAAFTYLTAAGDSAKVGVAKNRLLYAVIAIAVALVAKSVPYLVRSFLGQ
jgi:hypothetical protein